jgi:hypothetical protein
MAASRHFMVSADKTEFHSLHPFIVMIRKASLYLIINEQLPEEGIEKPGQCPVSSFLIIRLFQEPVFLL